MYCFFWKNLYIIAMDSKSFKKIPADILKNVQIKLDDVYGLLMPYLVRFTVPERKALAKIGKESITFLELSHRIAVNNSELFPSFLKISIFRKEFSIAHELWSVMARIDELREAINDTEMLAGNFALETALTFYKTVKIAARHDIPGAGVIYEELKSAFYSLKSGQQKSRPKSDKRQPELFESDELQLI